MAKQLLNIAESAESEAVKLAAVKDALDRAGLKAPTQVEVGVTPAYVEVFAGVSTISREESRRQRGLPAIAPEESRRQRGLPAIAPAADTDQAAPPIPKSQFSARPRGFYAHEAETADIFEAEIVDAPADRTAPHADVDASHFDAEDRADGPRGRPAWASDTGPRPPSKELVTLEEAAADMDRANRAAGVYPSRRRRR